MSLNDALGCAVVQGLRSSPARTVTAGGGSTPSLWKKTSNMYGVFAPQGNAMHLRARGQK